MQRGAQFLVTRNLVEWTANLHIGNLLAIKTSRTMTRDNLAAHHATA
jgi:hypothetical protein